MRKQAVIEPFSYLDPETGDTISISVSPFYSKLAVNDQEYYFVRETGQFDGTARTLERTGPVLAFKLGVKV